LTAILLLAVVSGAAEEARTAGEPSPTSSESPAVDARPFGFALSVADVEASARWYERVFGFRPVRSVDLEERGVHVRLLVGDGAFLELVQLRDARPLSAAAPGVDKRQNLHGVFKVGFEVDDLEAALERLARLDVELALGVVDEPDGSMRSAQVEDPDGNRIQLFEVLED
jgi:catechol 2,3-dioxygenase-like lactoylglutathione lyase family enzyme